MAPSTSFRVTAALFASELRAAFKPLR